MSIKEHKYIKLLDYAVEQKGSYHMEPGIKEANMIEREFKNIRDSLFINVHMQAPPPNKNQTYDRRLKPEAVLGYFAYKQYEHAQKSSKQTLYISSVSLAVATLTLVLTGLSVWL